MEAHVAIWPHPSDLTVTDSIDGRPVCRIGYVTINAEYDTQESMALEWLRQVRRAKAERHHAEKAAFRVTRPVSWSRDDVDPDQVRDEIEAGLRSTPNEYLR